MVCESRVLRTTRSKSGLPLLRVVTKNPLLSAFVLD